MKIYEKLVLFLSFALMVTMNALANILPINGIGTGAISDSYPNLFAPAGFTFAIWGLIYLLLLVMVVYLIGQSQSALASDIRNIRKLVWIFVISNLANTVWILAWHYRYIGITVVLMLIILVCLIVMMATVKELKWPIKRLAFIKPAVGVYFGWITVATVANITTFLVSIGWQRFGLEESVWMMLILVVATAIAWFAIKWGQCAGYGLVFIWAYYGILMKHLSPVGFNGVHGGVIVILAIAIPVILFQTIVAMRKTLGSMRKN